MRRGSEVCGSEVRDAHYLDVPTSTRGDVGGAKLGGEKNVLMAQKSHKRHK